MSRRIANGRPILSRRQIRPLPPPAGNPPVLPAAQVGVVNKVQKSAVLLGDLVEARPPQAELNINTRIP